MKIHCSRHPKYKGIRRSTTGCLRCKIVFGLRRIADACGFAVAQATPRKEPTCKHNFGRPLPHIRKYLFIGGRRNGQWHNVELDYGVGPDVLTVDEQQYFKVIFHGSSAGHEHIVYVEQGYDIKQAHQDVLRYERETPPDSGGKLC